jgi:hypothetical protein
MYERMEADEAAISDSALERSRRVDPLDVPTPSSARSLLPSSW